LWTVHASEQLEERRLAGSVWTEDADQFAALDGEEDIGQDGIVSNAGCRTSSRGACLPRASVGERHTIGP